MMRQHTITPSRNKHLIIIASFCVLGILASLKVLAISPEETFIQSARHTEGNHLLTNRIDDNSRTCKRSKAVQRLLPLLQQATYLGPDPDLVKSVHPKVTGGKLTMPAFFLPQGGSITFTEITIRKKTKLIFFLTSPKHIPSGILEIGRGSNTTQCHFSTNPNLFSPCQLTLPAPGKDNNTLTIRFPHPAGGGSSGIYIGSPILLTPIIPKPRPDIFLLTVDTLSALHMSCYGYNKKTSPFFDSLLSQGVFFCHAYSPAPWTRPSYASLLTGLPPSVHLATPRQVTHKGCQPGQESLRAGLTTLPETLRFLDYLTIGIYTVGNLAPEFGFSQGFDLYLNVPEMDSQQQFRHETAQASANALLQFIHNFQDIPLFIFINIIDPHTPYMPPYPYNKQFFQARRGENATLPESFNIGGGCRDCSPGLSPDKIIALYDGEVAYTDSQLKRIIQGIKQIGLYDKAMIIITADHGEELGNHRGWGHGFRLYEEHVRIPLWIRYRPVLPIGRKICPPVSTMDIYPTILELLKFPYSPTRFWGSSLLPLIFGHKKSNPVFTELINHSKAMESQRAVIFNHYKLISYLASQKCEFFNLKHDPLEQHPLPCTNKEAMQLSNILTLIDNRLQRYKTNGPLPYKDDKSTWQENRSLVKELKELGYIE